MTPQWRRDRLVVTLPPPANRVSADHAEGYRVLSPTPPRASLLLDRRMTGFEKKYRNKKCIHLFIYLASSQALGTSALLRSPWLILRSSQHWQPCNIIEACPTVRVSFWLTDWLTDCLADCLAARLQTLASVPACLFWGCGEMMRWFPCSLKTRGTLEAPQI